MSFILGDVTLPNPVSFERKNVEIAAENLLLNGDTNKKIVSKKEVFVLTFNHLTMAEVNAILSEYNLQEVRNFEANVEDQLIIFPTQVHIDISSREYNDKDPEYREDMELVLTEVSP